MINVARIALALAVLTLLAVAPGAHAESDGYKSMDSGGETLAYGDAGEQTYLAIKLENVQITSYQLGVLDNNASDLLAESVTIAHEEIALR